MAKCAQCGRKIAGLPFGKNICQWCREYEAVKRGEMSDDTVQRVMPAPWVRGATGRLVTQIIFGINIAVFLGMVLAKVSITDPSSQELLQWGANYGPWTLAGDWWRLVTNTFLHIGIIHIALNMWCLWSLGTLCESLYGPWTYAAVYLICGVSGSIASIAWHPYGISAGASGAIFGLAGALLASYKFGEFSLPRSLVSAQLSGLVFFLGYNLIFGALSGITDNAAHLGGLGAGFAMGVLIARLAPGRDAFASRIAVLAVGAALVVGAGFWLEHARGEEARRVRTSQLLFENTPAQAIPELQKLVRKEPSSVRAHLALAQAYLRAHRDPEAEQELKRILQIEPNDASASYLLGMTYLHEKRTAEAKNVFSQQLVKTPTDSSAHYGLGLALAAEGNHEAAIREFATVIESDPEASGACYEMGSSYLKMKKYDAAIAAFQKGQKAADDSYLESGLAEAYQAKGMKAEAAEAQRKATELRQKEALEN